MTLGALLLLGPPTIRTFTLALLLGVVSGTYSSIFNASQILVAWYEWGRARPSRRGRLASLTRDNANAKRRAIPPRLPWRS